ncbi:MAG TPA: hypothetical protein VIF14_03410 [Alphaproteobacteria bacterium]|jgi:hypothetical protein
MIVPRALARLVLTAWLTWAGAGPLLAESDQPGGISPSPPAGATYLGGQLFPNPTPLGPGIPRADILEVMVKAALMTFNDANLTGNYTVMSARLHPEFRQQVPPDRLASIFAAFRTNKISIAPLLAHKLVFSEPPSIDTNGLLIAKGQLETRPWRTTFDLAWRRDGDQWWLWKINVRVRPPEQ